MLLVAFEGNKQKTSKKWKKRLWEYRKVEILRKEEKSARKILNSNRNKKIDCESLYTSPRQVAAFAAEKLFNNFCRIKIMEI